MHHQYLFTNGDKYFKSTFLDDGQNIVYFLKTISSKNHTITHTTLLYT